VNTKSAERHATDDRPPAPPKNKSDKRKQKLFLKVCEGCARRLRVNKVVTFSPNMCALRRPPPFK